MDVEGELGNPGLTLVSQHQRPGDRRDHRPPTGGCRHPPGHLHVHVPQIDVVEQWVARVGGQHASGIDGRPQRHRALPAGRIDDQRWIRQRAGRHDAVEHVEVVLARLVVLGRDSGQVHAGPQRERPRQEAVLVGDQQHLVRWRCASKQPARVVEIEDVGGRDPGFHELGAGRHPGPGEVDAGVAVHVDREHVGQPAVAVHLDLQVAGLAAEVGDAQEDGACPGAGERLEGRVLVAGTDRDVGQGRGHPRRHRGRPAVTVAEQDDAATGTAAEDGVGQGDALTQVGAPAAGRGPVERRIEDRPVRGGRRQQLRVLAHQDHRHLLAGRQRTRELAGPGHGGAETIGRHVGGPHRGRGVDQDNGRLAHARRPGHPRAHQGGRDQERGQQLQEQQRAPAQPLPGRIGLAVGEMAAPEHQGRHPHLRPLHLQEVEEDDQGQRQGGQQPQRRDQLHALTPA